MSSAVTSYDLTIWCKPGGGSEVLYESVEGLLKRIAKCWVFQQETTKEGKLHYQVRLRLEKKRRLAPFIRFLHENEEGIPKSAFGKVSITSSTVHSTSDFNYVMKTDSRVDGPWRSDKPIKRKTIQLLDFEAKKFYHWQERIIPFFTKVDFRKINVILDLHGNTGKSQMTEYLEFHYEAEELPPFKECKDLMRAVLNIGPKKNYIIDMPRGMKKDLLQGLYSGIECIKNGMAYDDRYSFRKVRFNRPNVFVMTNQLPDGRLLTTDRWAIWRITQEKKELREVVMPPGWTKPDGELVTVNDIDKGTYDKVIPRMGLLAARSREGPFAHPEAGAGADTSSQHSLGSIPSQIDSGDLPLDFLEEVEEE